MPAGVVTLTREDVRDLAPRCGFIVQEVVAADVVRHVGDVVAAVAAPSEREAEAALDLIEVEYEELPAVFDPVAAMAAGAPLVQEGVHFASDLRPGGRNVCHRYRLRSGRGEAGSGRQPVSLRQLSEDPGGVPGVSRRIVVRAQQFLSDLDLSQSARVIGLEAGPSRSSASP